MNGAGRRLGRHAVPLRTIRGIDRGARLCREPRVCLVSQACAAVLDARRDFVLQGADHRAGSGAGVTSACPGSSATWSSTTSMSPRTWTANSTSGTPNGCSSERCGPPGLSRDVKPTRRTRPLQPATSSSAHRPGGLPGTARGETAHNQVQLARRDLQNCGQGFRAPGRRQPETERRQPGAERRHADAGKHRELPGPVR